MRKVLFILISLFIQLSIQAQSKTVEDYLKCDIKMMPSSAFQSIIKFNPSGQLLQKK